MMDDRRAGPRQEPGSPLRIPRQVDDVRPMAQLGEEVDPQVRAGKARVVRPHDLQWRTYPVEGVGEVVADGDVVLPRQCHLGVGNGDASQRHHARRTGTGYDDVVPAPCQSLGEIEHRALGAARSLVICVIERAEASLPQLVQKQNSHEIELTAFCCRPSAAERGRRDVVKRNGRARHLPHDRISHPWRISRRCDSRCQAR